MADKQPIRLTRQRAEALLDMVEKGLKAERAELSRLYGLAFEEDGFLNESEGQFILLEPGELERINDRLSYMTVVMDAASIVHRRYAS